MESNCLFLGTDPGGAATLKVLDESLKQYYNKNSIYMDLNKKNLNNVLQYIDNKNNNIVVLGTSIDMTYECSIIEKISLKRKKPKIFFYVDENYNVQPRVLKLKPYHKIINGIFYQYNTKKIDYLDFVNSYQYGSPLLDTDNPSFSLFNHFNYKYNSSAKWIIVDEYKDVFFISKKQLYKNSFLSEILKKNGYDLLNFNIRQHPKNFINEKSFITGETRGFIGYSSFFLSIAFLKGFSVISIADKFVDSVTLSQFPIHRKSINDLSKNQNLEKNPIEFRNMNKGSTEKILNCLRIYL